MLIYLRGRRRRGRIDKAYMINVDFFSYIIGIDLAMFTCPSISSLVCPCVCPSICSSVCLYACLHVCLLVYLYVCLYVCLFECLDLSPN